jgi:hypothetical protein
MMLCAALIHATPLVARAEPGQVFGGDDAGCVPDTKDHLRCGDAIAKAIARLVGGVLKCHVQQANARFKSAQSGGAAASAEEECEDGGSSKSAQGRFEAVLAKLDASSLCAGTSTTAVARDYATALVAELDGPRNGAVYCDGTLPIDATGDDAGTIDPTSKEHLRCADAVAKNLAKLFGAVVKCHVKTADQGLKGKLFDEESCEQDPPGVTGKGARGKYGAAVAKLVTGETCPPCLDANTQNGLGDDVVAELDRDNDRLYPCGGISTTTVVTTTSTTTTTLAPCTPIGGTARTFSISFMPPAGVDVAGVTVLVDYPEGQVSIPGSGNAASVKSSISNLPQGAFSSPNDLDYALREAVASSSALTPGRLFTITFQDCQGATAPTAADFTCTVEDASDPSGNPVSGVTCTVSAP